MKRITQKLMSVMLFLAFCSTDSFAYVIPDGKEIKNVFIGTLNSEGTAVIPEDFESASSLSSSWNKGTLTDIYLGEVTEVSKPEIGSAPDDGIIPTYVSGKVFQGKLRAGTNTGVHYASFNLPSSLRSGILVFSADLFAATNVNSPLLIRFCDEEGNPVLALNYANGSGARNFQYTIADGTTTNAGASSEYRKYAGYGIKDLVINLSEGTAQFTLDYIQASSSGATRKQVTTSRINIGTGKNIAKMEFGKAALSSTDLYLYMDNIELYTIGTAGATDNNYSIIAKCGDTEISTLAAGSCANNQLYTVTGLPQVIEKDDVFYSLNDSKVKNYSVSYYMGESNETKYINYEKQTDIIYFNDATAAPWKTADGTASGGCYGSWGNNSNICNLVLNAGTYQVDINVWSKGGKGSNHRKESIALNGTVTAAISDNSNGSHIFDITVLADNTTLSIYGNGSNKATDNIDYVLIRKTGDLPSTVSLTVSSAGLATYTPSYNLDFSSASKITAYKAAVSGTAITLTKVTTVAAGEGVLLRGKAGEETTEAIAVATSATTANAGNEFVPVTGEIDQLAETDGDYTNFVLNKVDGVVGFYKANNTHVAAGKAYLKVLTSTLGTETGKSMKLVFDDETTGITEVSNAAKASDKAYYTLSGQRVNAPVKGLYLHNGKKVIIK